MSASSEFIALCQTQVALLTQGLGAAFSAVYLTEDFVEGVEAKLVPIAAYPEPFPNWKLEQSWILPPAAMALTDGVPRLLSASSVADETVSNSTVSAHRGLEVEAEAPSEGDHALLPQREIVLPLVHEGVVLGLLVTSREDRPWDEWEQAQIEKIAHTLTLACVLDQRSRWLEHQGRQQQLRQAQQHDLLDTLLHQFRNPLTAIRTFGKLLLKRLLPGDVNRDVATSLIRESDRLQELLQQFDQVIDLVEVDAEPVGMGSIDSSITLDADQATQPEARMIPLLPASGFLSGTSLELEVCSVIEILEPLLVSAEAIAQERGLDLQVERSPALAPVTGNIKALQEVFSNLIDNALKYTPSGGRVQIQVGLEQQFPQGKYQATVISDTGSGIPPEDLGHIFERHYRGEKATTAIPGTGLGLAIAQDLVRRMQGNIQVFSPAVQSGLINAPAKTTIGGPGTAVVVWLPIAKEA